MRAFLLFLARKEGFKNFALKFRFFRDTASRFVAGETLDDAIAAVRQANRQNISGILDLLGENTRTPEDAQSACRDIIGIFDRIQAENVDCNVSVKLTQLGLDLDTDLAYRNLAQIVQCARDRGNFVRVDMEDSPLRPTHSGSCDSRSRADGQCGDRDPVLSLPEQARCNRPTGKAHPHPAGEGRLSGTGEHRIPEKEGYRCKFHQAHADASCQRNVSCDRHAR